MAVLSPVAKQQFFDNDGNPAAGFLLYTYATGTSTPLATYSDAAGATAHANPIVLDSAGRASIYIDSTLTYDFVLKTDGGVQEWTQASVSNPGGVSAALLASTATGEGAALIGLTQGGTTQDAIKWVTPEMFSGDIQTALDTGLTVRFSDEYTITETLTLSTDRQRLIFDVGASITCATADVDMFTLGDASILLGVEFDGAVLECGTTAGHVFTQAIGVAQFSFKRCKVTQNNPAKSLWANNGFLYIDMHWTDFDLQHVLTATVPGFAFTDSVGGLINSNSWQKGRCTYSGEYFFDYDNTSPNYEYDNVFRDINYEVCIGGLVRGLGMNNFIAENIFLYDGDLSGDTTNHGVYLGASDNASPVKSRGIALKNVGRRSSSLGVGMADIYFEASGVDLATIEGGDNATITGYTVELNSNIGVLILNPRNWTINGKSSTTAILRAAYSGISYLEIGGSYFTGRGETPEGTFSASPGSIYMRTTGGTGRSALVKESGTGNTGWNYLVTNKVSADYGDAAATLTVGTSPQTNVWATPLTMARAVTLSTTDAHNGAKFRIVRTAASTGAFNLNIAGSGLGLLAAEWADVEYDGSGWVVTGHGVLA